MVKIAPYGTWTSPIDAKDVASSGGGPSWLDMHGDEIWWAESLPAEGGRLELCRHRPGRGTDAVLGAPWNVRNRLHEYGGRPFVVIGAQVAFTHWDDQRIYLATPDGDPDGDTGATAPVPLTPEPARRHGWRYGDLVADPDRTALWCVRETVTGDLPTDIRRDLVAVPLDGSAATDPARVRVLASSHHFLTAPKPSPDGRHAAWLGWNHPAMPWDGTQLCVAEVTEAGFGPHRVLAGGPTEAVCQVEWDSTDALLAVTDPDGWWNVYRVNLDGTTLNLHPCQEELGGPLWRVGARYVAEARRGPLRGLPARQARDPGRAGRHPHRHRRGDRRLAGRGWQRHRARRGDHGAGRRAPARRGRAPRRPGHVPGGGDRVDAAADRSAGPGVSAGAAGAGVHRPAGAGRARVPLPADQPGFRRAGG